MRLALLLFVTDGVDVTYVAAAWLFVVFRAAHSVVHCTFNRVMVRFTCYLAASLALWFMLLARRCRLFRAMIAACGPRVALATLRPGDS